MQRQHVADEYCRHFNEGKSDNSFFAFQLPMTTENVVYVCLTQVDVPSSTTQSLITI